MWISPSQPLRRPLVIEPGLQSILLTAPPIGPPRAVRVAVLLAGPAALLVLLLARGLFRRRAAVLAGVTVGLVALLAGAISYLRAQDEPLPQQVSWEVVSASADSATGQIASVETLSTLTPLFSRAFFATCPPGAILTPVALSARDYFALREVRLAIGLRSASGETQPDALDAPISARRTIAYAIRSATIAGLVPALPHTAAQQRQFQEATHIDWAKGWWLEGGYVFPAGLSEEQRQGKGILFTSWAERSVIAGANAWYELRFDGQHRYFIAPDSGSAGLHLIDFGTAPQPASTP